MTNLGLNKLMEECGELVQIAAKKASYMDTDEHPDGRGSMKVRLEQESADVWAAIMFVAGYLDLDMNAIYERSLLKLATFQAWHADPNNQKDGDHA